MPLSGALDPDHDPVFLGETVKKQPDFGSATIATFAGEKCINYVAVGQTGTFTIVYEVTDTKANTGALAYVDVTNTPPTAFAITTSLHWRLALSSQSQTSYSFDATDQDGDTITLTNAVKRSGEGTVSHGADKIMIEFSNDPSDPPVSWNSKPRQTEVLYTVSDGCDTADALLTLSITNDHVPSTASIRREFHWRQIQNYAEVLLDPLQGVLRDNDGDSMSLISARVPSPATAEITESKTDLSFSMGSSESIGQAVSVIVTVSDGLDSAERTIEVTATNTEPSTGPPVRANYGYINFNNPIEINLLSQASDQDFLDRDHLKVKSCSVSRAEGETNSVTDVTNDGSGCTFVATKCPSGTVETELTYILTDGRADVSNIITIDCDPTIVSSRFVEHWRTVTTGKEFDILRPLREKGEIGGDVSIVSIDGCPNGHCARISEDVIKYTFTGTDRSALGDQMITLKVTNANDIPVTITVTNSAPVCKSHIVEKHWGQLQSANHVVELSSLASDADDLDKNELTIVSVDESNRASVNIIDASVSYRLTANFVGTDRITYQVSDGIEFCSGTISIQSTNTPPNPNDKSQSFHWRKVVSGSATITVTDGAIDPDGDEVSLKPNSQSGWDSTWATLDISGNKFTITKEASAISSIIGTTASVSYILTDGVAEVPSTARFSVTNSRPTVTISNLLVEIPAYTRVSGGQPINLRHLFMDSDSDDVPHLKINSIEVSGIRGQVAIENDHSVRYTPPPGTQESFTESFTYTITDGAQSSIPYRVTVTVVNNPPVARVINRDVRPGQPDTVNVVEFGCSDPDVEEGDNLLTNFRFEEITKIGNVYDAVSDVGGGKISYTPLNIPTSAYDSNNKIVQKFSFRCRDLAQSTDSSELIFTVSAQPPTTGALTVTKTREGDNGPVVTYDLFSDGGLPQEPDVKLKSVDYRGVRGTASMNGERAIRFTPRNLGKDTVEEVIRYTLTNGYRDASNTLTIRYENKLPRCTTAPVPSLSKDESVLRTVEPYGIIDDNGDTVTYSFPDGRAVNPTARFTMDSPSTGRFTVHTSPRESGVVRTVLELDDGSTQGRGQCTIEFNVVNKKPIARDISGLTFNRKRYGQTLEIDVSKYVSDPDNGDTASLHQARLGTCGGTVRNSNGRIRFDVAPNQSNCTIQYNAIDNDKFQPEVSEFATVTLTFVDVDPIANNDEIEINQGALEFITFEELLANDRHDNGDPMTFDITFFNNDGCSASGHCTGNPTVSGNGLIYQASSTNCDSDRFRYQVTSTDSSGKIRRSNVAEVVIRLKNCVCSQPLDIILVLDGSTSVTSDQWSQIKNFNSKLLDRLVISNTQVRLGVVQFATNIHTTGNYGFTLSGDRNTVTSKLNGLTQVGGGTNTRGGLRAALDMFKRNRRAGVPRVAVVLTDGDANLPCWCGGMKSIYPGCNTANNNFDYRGLGYYASERDGDEVCNNIGQHKWGGRKCSQCSAYDACQPCSDPTYESDYMRDKENIKTVAFAVGDALTSNGITFVKGMHFEGTFIRARWKEESGDASTPTLDELMSKIVDLSCRDNKN